MEFTLTENLLIQIEAEFNENGKMMFRVVTFFRHSHKVKVSDWYQNYINVKKIYQEILKIL